MASAPAMTTHTAMTSHGCQPRVDQVMMLRMLRFSLSIFGRIHPEGHHHTRGRGGVLRPRVGAAQ